MSLVDQDILGVMFGAVFGAVIGWLAKGMLRCIKNDRGLCICQGVMIFVHVLFLFICFMLVLTSSTGLGDCEAGGTLANQKYRLAAFGCFVGTAVGWFFKALSKESANEEEKKKSKPCMHALFKGLYILVLLGLLIAFTVLAANCAKQFEDIGKHAKSSTNKE